MPASPSKPDKNSEENTSEKRGAPHTSTGAAPAGSGDQSPNDRSHRFRRSAIVAAGLVIVAAVALASYFVIHRDLVNRRGGQPQPEGSGGLVDNPDEGQEAAGTSLIAGPRVALVIGNSNYRYVPKLPNPRNDARLIAETLRRVGFTLVGGGAQIDLDKPGLERALEKFSQQLQGASVTLFYFAGHGMQAEGENYLVPTSANPQRQSDVKLQTIDAQVVLDQMQDSDARLNIVILDACRNNPFAHGSRALSRGLAPMQAPEGTLIAYATQPGSVASDGTGKDSPYSSALSAVMLKRGLEFREAFNEVGLTVSKETEGAQKPWTASSPIDGHFYFAGAATPASAFPSIVAASTPSGEDAEILFWQSIQLSKDPRDFAAYLQQYPEGRFSALAQVRVSELSSPAPAATISTSPKQLASRENPVPSVHTDSHISRSLTGYLHRNSLLYVDALVRSDQVGELRSVVLSGRVENETDKYDAESKVRDFLHTPNLSIRNHITLDSSLASKTSVTPTPTGQLANGNTQQTARKPSCFGQCQQTYTTCVAACQSQQTSGSTTAQAGSAGSLLGGLFREAYHVCTSRCEDQAYSCTQLCQ